MQTGHEKTLTALMAALAGTNLIYGLGMIESGVTFDYAQLVIDNEMARMIKHVVGGVRVDDESLAVDDIAAVGSFGDFLSLDATMRHMRDTSQPELIDRRVREDWEARGASDMYTRAHGEGARPARDAPARAAARRRAGGRSAASSTRRTGSAPARDRRGRRDGRDRQFRRRLRRRRAEQRTKTGRVALPAARPSASDQPPGVVVSWPSTGSGPNEALQPLVSMTFSV